MAQAPKMQDLLAKYRQRLEAELDVPLERAERQVVSREYRQFREESLPGHLSWYERAARFAGKLLKLKVPADKAAVLQEDLDACHLTVTPSDVQALAFVAPVSVIVLSIIVAAAIVGSIFFTALFTFIGLVMIPILLKWPSMMANTWRMRSSNQMVLCVFYVVTYMRHTSNLELAIEFAADHLAPPLSLDLKKVLWDVESGTFENVRESLDVYLEGWKKYNSEFIEAFHLIESSLFEPSDRRRLELLDKSLDVILTGTYEKMLHYAHNLKGPITTLHMLGVILPVLGLVILPLIVSFLGDVKWYHIAMFYNVLLPIGVYYLVRNILSTRPTGYGDVDITELSPELKRLERLRFKVFGKEVSVSPFGLSFFLFIILFVLALSPPVIHQLDPMFDINITQDFRFLEYRPTVNTDPLREPPPGAILGPYGLGAAVLSLLFPLAFGLSIGLYLRWRTRDIIKVRDKAKKLEDEFAGALFQLGNRLGDGMPAEAAVGRVADVMEDTVSGQFFALVSQNIRKLGFGLKDAIFHPRAGALAFFPSTVIESSMKVLVESIRKGPLIAAQALTNVSRYIKEIHAVDERLRDLMADIVSDITSQINFLTPAIAGIVIGITSMITTILGGLGSQIGKLSSPEVGDRIKGIAGLFGDGIPTYYFQLVVGLYVVQIIYILTVMSNGIQNGADRLGERDAVGRNLIKSTISYCTIALVIMVLFNVIAVQIMGKTLGTG